jgi:D-tyrosyl-tRNA(Tyr) deacylase
MRAVIQRVTEAAVDVQDTRIARISHGLLVLLGVAKGDGQADVRRMVEKLLTLRVFADNQGKMNRSLIEVGGQALIVSQFTLLGDVTKGRRPGFDQAAPPDMAQALYGEVVSGMTARGIHVEAGSFGAHMVVSLRNDGPVTFILDTRITTPEDSDRT